MLSKEAEKKMEEALQTFTSNNGYWREMYDNAPSDTVKEYINISFCYYIPELYDGEISARDDELRDKLTIKDYEYLKKYSYGKMKYIYQGKINELRKKSFQA